MNIKQFLIQHKCTSNETHTSLKGGKYNIPDSDLSTFYTLYYQALSSKLPLYLTEKHLPDRSVLIIDYDFRYSLDNIQRRFDNSFYPYILSIYFTIFEKLGIDKKLWKSFFFTRETPYQFKDKYYKDGIHIIFPELCLDYNTLNNIRTYALPKLAELIKSWNLMNGIEDVYDKAVIQKNNWMLYGSTKPELLPYSISAIFNENAEMIPCMIPDKDLISYLSIRKNIDIYPVQLPSINNSNNVNINIKKEVKEVENKGFVQENINDEQTKAIQELLPLIRIQFPNYQVIPTKMKLSLLDTHNFYFVSTKDKYCTFVDREHNRSSPTQYIQITSRGYCIKCYNDECHGKSYPKEPIPLPEHIRNVLFPYLEKDKTVHPNLQSINYSSHNQLHNNDYSGEIITNGAHGMINTSNINGMNNNSNIQNTLNDVLHSMLINFPNNTLTPSGNHIHITDPDGNSNYIVPLSDTFNPIENVQSIDVRIGGQISNQGFNLRSYSGSSYGQIFPPVPIPIDAKYKNILFVNNLTVNNNNNTTINNIYKDSDNDELLPFEEDNETVVIMPDPTINAILLNSLNATHYDIAKFIFELNKDHYRCVNPEKGDWFQWDKHRWIPGNESLTIFLSEKLVQYYNHAKAIYKQVSNNTNKADTELKLKRIDDLIKKLKTSNFKCSVLSECAAIYYAKYKHFENKLNENHHLLSFNNGVYDLQKMEFRNGNPDDCITYTTGINYKPYQFGDNPDMEMFLRQILPNDDKRIYVLKFLATCLSGDNPEEKFNIWTGSGGNGKSKLVELIDRVLGDYSFKLPISLLTQKRQGPGQATPEIAGAKGKRFGVFQEPSENEQINVGLMKELTGGDKISCRGLYQGQMEYKPQFKLLLACNDLPNVPSNDGGTWRRLRVCEFTSRFVENPNPNNKEEFIMDKELNTKMENWKEDFMGMLIEYYKLYKKEGNREPSEVMKFTEEYKKNSSFLEQWFNENFEKTNSEEDYISSNEVYEKFKNDTGENISNVKFCKNFMSKFKIEKKQKRTRDEMGGSSVIKCYIKLKYKSDEMNNDEVHLKL
jgi:P4 family phage/plasmid primase-like protien